ncbi:caspase family protein [Amycolatopsis sp. NPDC088138]|uniref:caspase, EACC1-associated type n=1 Tax=Amycolatopsis sp. NPDC088138 TaxID=3363938 RepID=UPI003825C7CC
MNIRAVDPARSRIVLVGAPVYQDERLPDVPQVAANLADLTAAFTDPLIGGFPDAHCLVAPALATVVDIGRLLHAAAAEAEDLLLFYFAGHGLLGRDGDLYLALHEAEVRAPEYSALRFEAVRGTFLDSPAANRVVIVDSCYSGRTIGPTLGDEEQVMLGQLEIGGTYTLASAPPNSRALVREDEPHTAFTGRLLKLLRDGTSSAGELLSLGDIYRQMYSVLRADRLPLPQQRGTATADLLGLVRNRGVLNRRSVALRGRAEALLDRALLFAADLKGDNWDRANVVVEIAEAMAVLDSPRVIDFVERAEQLARSIIQSKWKCAALARLAEAVVAADPGRAEDLLVLAEQVAATLTAVDDNFMAAAAIAKVMAATEPDRAASLVERALSFDLTDPHLSLIGLSDVVEVVGGLNSEHRGGILDQLERILAWAADNCRWAQSEVAEALAMMARIHLDRAVRIAEATVDESFQCSALVQIGTAVLATDPGRATNLFEKAEQLVLALPEPPKVSIWDPLKPIRTAVYRFQAWTEGNRYSPGEPESPTQKKLHVLTRVADLLAGVAPERTLALLGQLDELKREHGITARLYGEDRVYASLACAIAATDVAHAERIAVAITDTSDRERAWAGIARSLAEVDLDRALAAADKSFGADRDYAIVDIAHGIALSDPDRADYLVASVRDVVCRPVGMAQLAKAWLTVS